MSRERMPVDQDPRNHLWVYSAIDGCSSLSPCDALLVWFLPYSNETLCATSRFLCGGPLNPSILVVSLNKVGQCQHW